MAYEWVWIFNGAGVRYPSGVFEDKERAEIWINQHRLAGVLTKYPVNVSAYDWAIEHNYFTPKKEHHTTGDFVGRFSAGFIAHEHYDNEHATASTDVDSNSKNTAFAVSGWVWVFTGKGGIFPSGVFETQAHAQSWIAWYCLSGTLSKYPVGISVHQWAIESNLFTPENDLQQSGTFISAFGRDVGEHIHYVDGQ